MYIITFFIKDFYTVKQHFLKAQIIEDYWITIKTTIFDKLENEDIQPLLKDFILHSITKSFFIESPSNL